MELLKYNWIFTEVPANYFFILILIKFKADLEFLSTVSFQVFVFLAAEYETHKNSLNQVKALAIGCIFIFESSVSCCRVEYLWFSIHF